MRTIPNLTTELKPLDDVVENEFLPAITEGHQCTPDEWTLLSLPMRISGMGIPKFIELCKRKFHNSVRAAEQLTKNIEDQVTEFDIDQVKEKEIHNAIKKETRDLEEKTPRRSEEEEEGRG